MFVNKQKVAVSVDDGVNVIFIKPKMGFGSKQRVMSASTRITDPNGGAEGVTFDLGRGNIALLVENIVGWSGPLFEDEKGKTKPVNPYTIEDFDPDSPLLTKVLTEINERNKAPEAPKPVAGTGAAADEVGDGEDAEFAKVGVLEEALTPNL